MTAILEAFTEMAKTPSVFVYFIIFFGKLLEVTTSTLRIVLINRGIRSLGCLLASIEIVLWLLITSTVLSGFSSDPLKILVYAAAFASGNFLGSWLDEKLAFGLSSIQIVVSNIDEAHRLSQCLRENGYGITTMDVHGMDGQDRFMTVAMTPRKRVQSVIRIVNSTVQNAVITVSDVKVQKGGYLRDASTRPHPHVKIRAKWESRVNKSNAQNTAASEHAPAATKPNTEREDV